MRRERLILSPHQSVETYRDGLGRAFIAYSNGTSVLVREAAELRRFLKVPKGLPMRAALDSWLDSLQATDAERTEPSRAEVLATGFGPECHLDESDPNYNTRTVI